MSGDTISRHNKLLLLRTRDADEFDVDLLIAWSRDEDDEVRDWATFQLGCLDTADVRQALRDRLDDPHFDTRSEALVGLARRRDQYAVKPLLAALQDEPVGTLMVEAAGYFGSPEFVPALEALRSWWDVDTQLLEKAIAHCSGEKRDSWFDCDRSAGNDNMSE